MHLPSAAPRRALGRLILAIAMLAPLFNSSTPVRAIEIIRVNFQSPNAAIPVGYVRDYGLPYGERSAAETGTASSPGPLGMTYGWVDPASNAPLNLAVGGSTPGNGRDRNLNSDQRLDTLMHMQANNVGSFNGTRAEGKWEIALVPGLYIVTVAAGDADTSSVQGEQHTIRVEGTTAIANFVSTGAAGSSQRHKAGTVQVNVADGKLTIDAQGGFNTKINYVEITSTDGQMRPYLREITPADGATGVLRNTSVSVTVNLPPGHAGLRSETVTNDTVQLTRAEDQTIVSATVNTSAGGDIITLVPTTYLDPSTRYIFRVTDGVKDGEGASFIPFETTFTTGTGGGPGGSGTAIAFEPAPGVAKGTFFSSLTIGPDNRLYVANLLGDIFRYPINADGTLGASTKISTIRNEEGGSRAIIGLAFDPSSTADNLILWVSHSGPYVAQGAPDWTGKIARLSGSNLQNFQNYVVNLPHSYKDHMPNSLAFGPDGNLYIPIGSNSAMGAADDAWGQYPERLLSAAVLRIDLDRIDSPPLDVKTEEGGNYNPFASNAAVTIYATGVRNAYDLVWHSNGELYVPTNGSAAGGNTPATPSGYSSLPACKNRIDDAARGDYTSPNVPGLSSVPDQNDYLFRVEQRGYYGHPNPLRCEWVMNGGNPTNGTDPAEVRRYAVGVQPDRNYRGFAYDFGVHKSPNGAIEYRSNRFNGELRGKLLVARYGESDDIIVLTPNDTTGDIGTVQEGLAGLTGLSNPLDIVEDTRNGNLYVTEFGTSGPSQVTLLRPVADTAPRIKLSSSQLVFTDVQGGTASAAQQVVIENIGQSQLNLSAIGIVGTNANQFAIVGPKPTSVAGGETVIVEVAFDPTTAGPKSGLLRISSNAANGSTAEVVLRGLSTAGVGGANEPSLQWIFDTLEIGTVVGDDNPATGVINSSTSLQRAALLGDEVALQRFERADSANPVVIEPLAVFGPSANDPVTRFGWYPSGNSNTKNELFAVGNTPSSNAQTLLPALKNGATLTFDPGTASFGFYSIWPFFKDRVVYSEDALNTWDTTPENRHKLRVYPLKNSAGTVVPNAYVVATEEHTTGFDYQDVVVIVRNVRPASTTPGNTPPTVDAGADLTVQTGAEVSIQGGASDANGDTLSYAWTQVAGAPVSLSGADSLALSFTAPNTASELTFRLTVSDGKAQVSDDVTVSVIDSKIEGLTISGSSSAMVGEQVSFGASISSGSGVFYAWSFGDGGSAAGANVSHTFTRDGTYQVKVTASNNQESVDATLTVVVTNQAPVARAGANRTVMVGEAVALDASASSDPEGHTPLSYAWQQVSGTPVTLSNPDAALASFSAPSSPGTLVFRVTVTDAYDKSASAEVTITVTQSQPNRAPVVTVGPNQQVRSGERVTLAGSASDPDGHTLTFAWVQTSGPEVNSIEGANSLTAGFTAPATAATLVFELTVTDQLGLSSRAQTTVTVGPNLPANRAPIAVAGANQQVRSGTLVTLDGSGSGDPDGNPLTFAWVRVSGPAVSLQNANSARPTFTAPATSSRVAVVFELTVTDPLGLSSKAQTTVTIDPPTRQNRAPVVIVSAAQQVRSQVQVTLNASASYDPDGDTISFSWRQLSGPQVALTGAATATPRFVAPSGTGTATFEVTVSDSFGASAKGQVSVSFGPSFQQHTLYLPLVLR